MASITDILLDLASRQAQQVGRQQENQYAAIRNQFAPEGFRLENALRQGQINKIPAEIKNLLADAAFRQMETQFVPTKYNIEQQNANTSALNADISNRTHSPEQLQANLDNIRSMIAYRQNPGMANRGLSAPSKMLREADALEAQGNAKDAALLRQAAQKAARDPNLFRKATEYDNALEGMSKVPIQELAQYAGIFGSGKSIEQGLAARFGINSPEYTQYYNFTRVQLPYIAEDIRRALGTSITPEMQKYINNISDPLRVDGNPELAISSWNALQQLVATQAKNYYLSISGPVDFKKKAQELESRAAGEGMENKGAPPPLSRDEALKLLQERKRQS